MPPHVCPDISIAKSYVEGVKYTQIGIMYINSGGQIDRANLGREVR